MSIKITRDDFVAAFVNCKKAPAVLSTKLEKAPFCHLLSTYVIRPVACDENPFFIHHKNKQPVLVAAKKTAPRRPKAAEVTSFDDSDDDFEKVETDKKRVKAKAVAGAAEVNPQFPASDPSKVIVIGAKKATSGVLSRPGPDTVKAAAEPAKEAPVK